MDSKQLFGEEWYEALKPVIESDYWSKIGRAVAEERDIRTIYPEKNSELFFKAFRTTPLSKVKVVILGQDPYHDGSYDGFAFSNSLEKRGRISPSLQNILTEVHNDVYPDVPMSGWLKHEMISLERWAEQGVLLINTAHTVVKGVPNSHIWLWKYFTTEVLRILLETPRPLAFILWGRHAQNIFSYVEKGKIINYWSPREIIRSAHPSPFSAYQGFFGSKPFSRTNGFLQQFNFQIINW